ncbi:metalloprotease [Coemansia sp. RSA 1365]|nr:metalloprotease [Coemansia sp. RSA 1365]
MNPFDVKQPSDWETGFEPRITTESRMPYKEYIGPLEKSAKDNCQYRLLRLPNNMVVICISDPDAKTAAAALTVGVGSYADPNDALGLAHLLEHMLLMGSAKYPGDGSFREFISNHSGSSNAFTRESNTCYYFDIDNEVLDSALDRMSSFFIKPLLSAEAIIREINAVDSEYQSQLTSEGWRLNGLKASLSNPNHPYSRFAAGNNKTLNSSDSEILHNRVVEFYNRYYSADIMKLAITGSYTLDELTEMAVSRFSAVESKGITKPTFADHPMTNNELGKVIHFETLSDINEICLTFPLPDIRAHNRSRPIEYIRWLLNHEGPGSLTQYLNSQGLATYAVAVIKSFEGYSIFTISISVTPNGLKEYDQVVSAIFAYLRMLSKSRPQERIYNEIAATLRLGFEYYEQPNSMKYVIDLSCDATNDYVSPEYIISNGTIMNGFSPSLISAFLELLNNSNYSVFIGAKTHEEIDLSNTEEYHNVRYHVSDLPNTLTTDFCQDESMLSHFHLPKPNDFFSDNFSVPEPTGPRPKLDRTVPTLLKYNDKLELWYKQDDKFYLPKGVVKLEIKSPVINSSPCNRVMFDLLCNCWRYILARELYSSKCAGLSYSISSFYTAANITVDGFSQKLPLLLERIVSHMRHAVIKESIFNDCRNKLQESLSYSRSISAATQASFWEANLLLCPTWDTALLEESLKDVTYEMLNNFLHTLFEKVHITMLVTGNFTEQQAMDTAFNVQNIISGQPLLSCEIPYVRTIQLDPGYYIFPRESLNENNAQSAAVANIQLGKASEVRSRAIAVIFNDIFNTLFFDQLRTEEQLGYIVYSTLKTYSEGNLYLILSIQGECNPIYLSLRITEFLRTCRQNIVDLDEDKVANAVKSLSLTLQEQLKTISSEASRMWNAINSGEYSFESISEGIECLKTIGKQDIIEMWDTFINPDTVPQYTRIDVHIWPTNAQLPSAAELENYPASLLALQRLLKNSTDSDINLEELNSFVKAASLDSSQDDAYKKLLTLYSTPQELLTQESSFDNNDKKDSSSESDPKAQKIRIALQMALEGAVNAPDYHKHCTFDFTNIGMCQTCEGIWVIGDINKFQNSQMLHGVQMPITKLVPKYKE